MKFEVADVRDSTVARLNFVTRSMENTDDCITVNANYKPLPPHPTAFVNVSNLVFRSVTGEQTIYLHTSWQD